MPFSDELNKKINECLLMGEELLKSMVNMKRRNQVTDQRRFENSIGPAGTSMAQIAPKNASLCEIIEIQLDSIIERSQRVSGDLTELENFIFGPRDCNDTCDESPVPQTWQQRIKYKLNRIEGIQHTQLETLESISKFHR